MQYILKINILSYKNTIYIKNRLKKRSGLINSNRSKSTFQYMSVVKINALKLMSL